MSEEKTDKKPRNKKDPSLVELMASTIWFIILHYFL
jgi:hypothetical protein